MLLMFPRSTLHLNFDEIREKSGSESSIRVQKQRAFIRRPTVPQRRKAWIFLATSLVSLRAPFPMQPLSTRKPEPDGCLAMNAPQDGALPRLALELHSRPRPAGRRRYAPPRSCGTRWHRRISPGRRPTAAGGTGAPGRRRSLWPRAPPRSRSKATGPRAAGRPVPSWWQCRLLAPLECKCVRVHRGGGKKGNKDIKYQSVGVQAKQKHKILEGGGAGE